MVGGDALTINGSGNPSTSVAVTILYATDGSGDISMTLGGHTVLFGPGLSNMGQTPGGIRFVDHSTLYIGDGLSNNFNQTFFSTLNYQQNGGENDAAFGGDGNDVLDGGGSNFSLLQGNAGNDRLTVHGAHDTVYGGQGADTIAGSEFSQGNKGDDSITGSIQDSTLLGGQGDDTISAPGAIVDGNLGNDSISGGGDTLHGVTTGGQILGEGGNDTLASIHGANDTISGGDGDDSIVAGSGADSITGDAGADTISTTGHAAHIAGGAGADVFIINSGTTAAGPAAAITDWTASEDRIHFTGFTPNPADYTSTTASDYSAALSAASTMITQSHFSFVGVQVGADVVIFAGGSSGVTAVVDLIGRSLNDFDPHNNLI
ncbi:MAG: hypothetical protein JSR98_22565 [Proteobacteria bacterium]|nr:hypothetical protein [Pseudomonadota bacterium]